jgi:1,4-dihydroxy-2-naphthoyl-CoA synthase
MAYHDIILEKQDSIARITPNRPEALRAFREPMRADIGLAKTIMHRSAELNFYVFLEYEA